ncbi:hypothetical protein GOV13_00490 [Candidatus Pacearchaeota archaeon]|nr:hypothetical protein [Candidatus Pacearchaeota archaeon]
MSNGNITSRTITGMAMIILGVFLTILSFFVGLFILIYGLPILILGIFVFFNKKEDDIEKIKKSKGGKNE